MRLKLRTAAVLGAALLVPSGLWAQSDATGLEAALSKALDKKQFKQVQGTVRGDTAVLRGTVEVYNDKEEAEKCARRAKGIKAVENDIEVAGPSVPDAELRQKLVKEIAYSRVGYGSTPFNAISVAVQDGVVTLGGHAIGPVSASDAVGIASTMKGVKDVVDEIVVDPLSPFDNTIRLAAYRRIYGYPSLNKYAIDPAQPIRISVQNGTITLYGSVLSQSDKDVAGIQANQVPNAFKVINNLQVQGSSEGK